MLLLAGWLHHHNDHNIEHGGLLEHHQISYVLGKLVPPDGKSTRWTNRPSPKIDSPKNPLIAESIVSDRAIFVNNLDLPIKAIFVNSHLCI